MYASSELWTSVGSVVVNASIKRIIIFYYWINAVCIFKCCARVSIASIVLMWSEYLLWEYMLSAERWAVDLSKRSDIRRISQRNQHLNHILKTDVFSFPYIRRWAMVQLVVVQTFQVQCKQTAFIMLFDDLFSQSIARSRLRLAFIFFLLLAPFYFMPPFLRMHS